MVQTIIEVSFIISRMIYIDISYVLYIHIALSMTRSGKWNEAQMNNFRLSQQNVKLFQNLDTSVSV